MEVITSLSNNKIKDICKLQQKKYRDIDNKFIVEGEHLVLEAYRSGKLIEILKTEDYECDINVPITNVSYEIIKKISNTINPQRIVGIVSKFDEKDIDGNVVIVDGLQDPGNLGTIIRSCVAFNVKNIVLGENSVDVYNDKVIRSSEGMIFKINVVKDSIENVINKLKKSGYKIYGTKVDGGTNIKEFINKGNYALIVGNEGNGVRKEILDICDNYLYIPMSDECESLNVAIATSIILHELGD